jgi:hypothetical protein
MFLTAQNVIARLAGGGWEEKLHAAALGLAAAALSENSGSEVILDILSVFMLTRREKIFSRDLAAVLRTGFGGIMSAAVNYSSLNEYQISQMLRPYGIRPSAVRVGKVVQKGYTQADFLEALRRYVPDAEFKARLEELRRRGELQAEANAEAEKEAALIQELTKGKSILPYMAARLGKPEKENLDGKFEDED